ITRERLDFLNDLGCGHTHSLPRQRAVVNGWAFFLSFRSLSQLSRPFEHGFHGFGLATLSKVIL
ncbi:MAG TPA: hypothetical protein VLZ30_10035, partial [Verrucomicrobiae bacterium]|nr:hypothetical protein [Verrucomicrobiae bacterium]